MAMRLNITIAIVEDDNGVYVEHTADGGMTGAQVAYVLQHFVRLLLAKGARAPDVRRFVNLSMQAGPAMRVQ